LSFLYPNQKSVSKNDQTSDFKLFWKEFRQAAIDSDSVRLMNMTQFPLKTHGDQDEDPKIDIDKNSFYKVFNIYLERKTVYYNGVFQKNVDEIRRTLEPKKNDGNEKWMRIGDLTFNKIDNSWKLTLIYIDTNNLK